MSKTLDLLGSPRWFNAGGMRAFALRQRMHQLVHPARARDAAAVHRDRQRYLTAFPQETTHHD